MALLYALLALCAALIVAAYRWRYALIPAFVCVGIVAFVSVDRQPSASPDITPAQNREKLSIDNLPPYVEVLRTQRLQNGAEVILLKKNVIIQPLKDGDLMFLDVEDTCAIYRDERKGIVTDLGC